MTIYKKHNFLFSDSTKVVTSDKDKSSDSDAIKGTRVPPPPPQKPPPQTQMPPKPAPEKPK
jgi:hypothetical protein